MIRHQVAFFVWKINWRSAKRKQGTRIHFPWLLALRSRIPRTRHQSLVLLARSLTFVFVNCVNTYESRRRETTSSLKKP